MFTTDQRKSSGSRPQQPQRSGNSGRPPQNASGSSQKKRRLSKKARRRRRIVKAIVISPIIIIILVLLFLIFGSIFFRVEDFSMSGSGKYESDEIIAASGIEEGDSLMWISVKKSEKSILKKLPYIESVTIKRRFPHTVTVEYKQVETIYGVCVGDKWVLTDPSFKVLEILEAKPEETAMLIKMPAASVCEPGSVLVFEEENANEAAGDESTAAQTEKDDKKSESGEDSGYVLPIDRFNQIMTEVNSTSLKGKVTEVDVSDEGALSIVYDGRIRIKLGAAVQLADKLKLAAGALQNEDKIDPTEKGTLDVSIADEAYFRPEAETSADFDEEEETTANLPGEEELAVE